jgi:hypothetical protein
MRGFVLARRSGNRLVDDLLIEAHPDPTPDRNNGSSYLFYPADSETANWCVVYLRNRVVHRVDLLPD